MVAVPVDVRSGYVPTVELDGQAELPYADPLSKSDLAQGEPPATPVRAPRVRCLIAKKSRIASACRHTVARHARYYQRPDVDGYLCERCALAAARG